MATSPLFGWEEPDDSDLVKDGAAAIRTLGNAIDTSMGDLLGGTTGQVLAKASNTNMDFTWVAQDDSNAIQNAIVDAKGDLIAASAADTPARLAVGNNGETIVADSSTATGLRYQANFAAGKNKIINGAFDVWQRGTSFALSDGAVTYTTDRFYSFLSGTFSATVSRQAFTAGTAPAAPYEGQYFWRNTISSITGTLGFNRFGQRIEDVRTLANQAVTISFWAKAGASASWTPQLVQDFGSGGSSAVFTSGTAISVTTSWQRFSQTITLPSISGKTIGTGSNLTFIIDQPTTGAQTNDVWGVQVEAGSVATAFQTATGTIQGELAACQRYYYRATAAAIGERLGVGYAGTTTTANIIYPLPVTMRIAPTAIETTGTGSDYSIATAGGNVTCTTTPAFGVSNAWQILFQASVASGLTAGQAIGMRFAAANAYVGVTAEL